MHRLSAAELRAKVLGRASRAAQSLTADNGAHQAPDYRGDRTSSQVAAAESMIRSEFPI